MQAIATEIIVAAQNTDIQKLQPQIKQSDYSVSGKSFADMLSSYMNEMSDSVDSGSAKNVESVDAKSTEQTNRQSEVTDKKTSESVEKAPETAKNDDKKEKIDEGKGSPKEEKSDEVKKSDSESVKDKKNPKQVGKNESIEEKISYLRLDLIKGENLAVTNTAAEAVAEDGEIKKLSENLLEKITLADDSKRVEVLENEPEIALKNDFDFDLKDVSSKVVLETAQETAIGNSESLLAQMEVSVNEIASDSNLSQIKAEKSSIYDSSEAKSRLEKSNSKLTVTDLRTKKSDNEINVAKLDDAEPKLKVKTVIDSSDTATITMDLNQPSQNVADNVLSLNNQAAGADGSNFQAMLNNQIQSNVTEFVKASNIILKDNGKGTINLVLHPDDLGDVKFHLSLDGDKITGHITVNTKEALQVFKDNAQTLREAFIKSGFENAGFEVSYNSSGNNSDGNFNQQNRQEMNSFFGRREYGSLNDAFARQSMSFENDNFGELSINIVA